MKDIEIANELYSLYKKQIAIKPDNYLNSHSRHQAAALNRINSYKVYMPYVKGTILDWGCRHALDSCIIKYALKSSTEIYGCDTCDRNDYEIFHKFCNMEYKKLDDPFKIPFEDNKFDTVIGAGVLEHVPSDIKSICELWRIIKMSGFLILTYLPNETSYTEFVNRHLKNPHHKKRFTKKTIYDLLLHNGFLPIEIRYHQMIPTQLGGFSFKDNFIVEKIIKSTWHFNSILEKVWPINMFSTNLIVIAQKVATIP